MHTVPGLPQPPAPGGVCRLMVMLMALVFLSACAPSNQAEEELRKEIQALKAQVAATQEKLNQVQAGQQAILDLLKKPELPGGAPGRAEPTPGPRISDRGPTPGQQRPLPGRPGEGQGHAGPGYGAP